MDADTLNPILRGQPAPPLLIVISGPSGVGKDTVLMRMRERGLPFHFVVTATSRAMRPTERDGYDYHFVSEEGFRAMITSEELLEWAEVYGHYKGIPKNEVRQAHASGRDVVLRVDVQGAATIKKLAPDALCIFLAPANVDELRNRLRLRRTESQDEMERRLSYAMHELDSISIFDYVIINREDQLDTAVSQICSVIEAEKLRVRPRRVTL